MLLAFSMAPCEQRHHGQVSRRPQLAHHKACQRLVLREKRRESSLENVYQASAADINEKTTEAGSRCRGRLVRTSVTRAAAVCSDAKGRSLASCWPCDDEHDVFEHINGYETLQRIVCKPMQRYEIVLALVCVKEQACQPARRTWALNQRQFNILMNRSYYAMKIWLRNAIAIV